MYAAPICSIATDSRINKLQRVQNKTLTRISKASQKLTSAEIQENIL